MFELTAIVDFEAAHSIRDYPGKCSRIHGHNWKVEISVAGSKLDQLGMLIDFRDLKGEVTAVLAALDHYYLNEVVPFTDVNPTAEHIARHIYDTLAQRPLFSNDLSLSSIKVWESLNSAALYKPD